LDFQQHQLFTLDPGVSSEQNVAVASVAVIIPAFNEGPRVGAVIRAALGAKLQRHVLVVDDGSKDDTAAQAQAAGADVLRLIPNRGKAGAMDAGVRRVRETGVCFVDADLTAITSEQIDLLIAPFVAGADMVVGMDQRIQRALWSVFGGCRVLSRSAWLWATMGEPSMLASGYGIEIGLAALANRYRWEVVEVPLYGIEAPDQTAKWGGSSTTRNLKMWSQIAKAAARVSRGRIVNEVLKPMLLHHGFLNRRPF
jgi:glycosyltransferase involved in cell wall biosynthesis